MDSVDLRHLTCAASELRNMTGGEKASLFGLGPGDRVHMKLVMRSNTLPCKSQKKEGVNALRENRTGGAAKHFGRGPIMQVGSLSGTHIACLIG